MYQIRSRFSEFLQMILKLNQIQSEINSCYERVRKLRAFSKHMKSTYIEKGIKIIQMKKKYMRIQETLQIVPFPFHTTTTILTST